MDYKLEKHLLLGLNENLPKLNRELVINDRKTSIKGAIDVVVPHIIWRLNSVKHLGEPQNHGNKIEANEEI